LGGTWGHSLCPWGGERNGSMLSPLHLGLGLRRERTFCWSVGHPAGVGGAGGHASFLGVCWGEHGEHCWQLCPWEGTSPTSPVPQLRQKLELPGEPARSGSARALEAQLREAEGESQRLRAALEKKTQELQRSLRE